jgi:hypothetical protein
MRITVYEGSEKRTEVWLDEHGDLHLDGPGFKPWLNRFEELAGNVTTPVNGFPVQVLPIRNSTLRQVVHMATVLASAQTGKDWHYTVDGPITEAVYSGLPPY